MNVLMALLEEISHKRPSLKIIMSATLDAQKFKNYFNAPLFWIHGKTLPDNSFFEEDTFGSAQHTNIRKSLALGLFHRTAIRHEGDDTYRTIHQNFDALIDPRSALIQGNHEWIVDLPYFSLGRMPTKHSKDLVQPFVKESLDNARARANRKALSRLGW
ncbi:hypothetical protein F4818DRAFT_446681 [Hypoxylon cercidicola]|nr:hypothetical protein F4818DRAFT_446681 [Hypoxylon cercidicola]